MNSLEDTLNRLRGVDGVVNAGVVATATGQVLACLHPDDPDQPVVAAAATDVVRALQVMTMLSGHDSQVLEDVLVTVGTQHHVVRPLGDPEADGLFVLVTLDRTRTNLALSLRQVRDLGPVRVA